MIYAEHTLARFSRLYLGAALHNLPDSAWYDGVGPNELLAAVIHCWLDRRTHFRWRFQDRAMHVCFTAGEVEVVLQHKQYASHWVSVTKDNDGSYWPIPYVAGGDWPTYIEVMGYKRHTALERVGFYIQPIPEEIFDQRVGSTIIIGTPWWFSAFTFLVLAAIACNRIRRILCVRRWRINGSCLQCGYLLLPTNHMLRAAPNAVRRGGCQLMSCTCHCNGNATA